MNISHKMHLANLPNLTQSQVPPRPEKVSKRALVLIPIFNGEPLVDNVSHHVAMSAVWARRSWMLHSDANHYGIEVKFYVEECVRDRALPILERNFVEEGDIIYFDGSQMEGALPSGDGFATFGAKKTAIYTDDRFRDYDWIFDVDSDIFAVSWSDRKVWFFEHFFENCRFRSENSDASEKYTQGTFFASKPEGGPPYATAVDLGWCRGANGSTTDASIADWKRRFETIVDRQILERFMSPDIFMTTYHGGLTAFPAKHFMRERREDCEFLVDTARVMAGTEATLAIWRAKGNAIFDMSEFFPMVLLHSDFDVDALIELKNLYKVKGRLLFHYSHPGIDLFWREGIGAL